MSLFTKRIQQKMKEQIANNMEEQKKITSLNNSSEVTTEKQETDPYSKEIESQQFPPELIKEDIFSALESDNNLSQFGNEGESSTPTVPHSVSCSLDSEKSTFDMQENSKLSNEEIKQLYTTIAKYGCLTFSQIKEFLSEGIALRVDQEDSLETTIVGKEKIYFHTEKSIKDLSSLTADSYKELLNKALYKDKVDEKDLANIIGEVRILLAFEKACEKQKHLQIDDWISSINPLKKRSLKIRRCDGKRGSLKPNFLITFKRRNSRCCLIFHILPLYNASFPGERREKYKETLFAYNAFFLDEAVVEKWKHKVGISLSSKSGVGVALLFSCEDRNMIQDLSEELHAFEIKTPLFLGTIKDILKNPISGWSGNYEYKEKEMFLQIRGKQKRMKVSKNDEAPNMVKKENIQ